MSSEELSERQREVLRAVVVEHISTGGPVGSSQAAKKGELDLSSATVRNVMADLEELGYLEKPHASAGRIPTDRGYRFYVDTLVQLRDPLPKDRERIEQGIAYETGVDEVLHEASKILHSLTHHAGVVLTPKASAGLFRRIEFVRLREDRVLAILVGQTGQVQNKVFTLDFAISAEELISSSNYLNELLNELPWEEVRGKILSEMEREQALYNALTSKALKLGIAATDVSRPDRVLIEGAGSFFDAPEFADIDRIRAVFHALDEKHKLLALLDRVQKAREMQIYIGAESDFSSAGDVAIIASPYGGPQRVLGTVGVIGPVRMNYQRVIPLVQFTAQVLSKVL
jgi:heat-inducible transcriptional repressor